MNSFVRLLRIHHWYKNLVIFIAIFFTMNLFNPQLLTKTILGFISLCFMSSSYYILNDMRDAEEDRVHPEKKNRPIASGEVTIKTGLIVSLGCFIVSVLIAYTLSLKFLVFPLLLFISSTAYNLGLKDIAFVDIHLIAINFLLRAISGAVLIKVEASAWLISTVFFLALLLGLGKRRTELTLLGEKAVKHKKVYEVYTEKLLDKLILLVSAVLLIAYSLYTFQEHEGGYMMLTIPFATFIVFRYLYLTSINHVAARKTQLIFTDRQILTAFLLWIIVSFLILYNL